MVNGAHSGYSGHTMEVSTMRLFKKAAVCLLAAAMAVSMLTACGDDGPSNPGNGGNGGSTGGGNTSTSTPAKPDEGNSGNTSGGSEENGTTTLPTNWNASKTKNYYNKYGISDTNIYVSGTLVQMDKNGTQVDTEKIEYAVKGLKTFTSMTTIVSASGQNSTTKVYKNNNEYYVYTNDRWHKCENEKQINAAKLIIQLYQEWYKVPSSPYHFVAYTESGKYYESAISNWTDGTPIQYSYAYNSTNHLMAMACTYQNNVAYITSSVVLTSCPDAFAFPQK